MIPIIDAGHGSDTPGKRSKDFYFPNGKVQLKENSVNEAVANKLSFLYWQYDQEAYFITNEWFDVSLHERCNREIKLSKTVRAKGASSVFISIHADAFEKNEATGGRFFYHSDSGKKIADQLTKYLRENGYELKLREPAQANFKVLRDTSSPAVLFEMGFMTTKSDLDKLLDDDFRNNTALLLYEALNVL